MLLEAIHQKNEPIISRGASMQVECGITANEGLEKIPSYVSGQAHGKGITLRHNLASNEAALGVGTNAREAYLEFSERIFQYPVPDAVMLREAIAEYHELNRDQIVCCNGSEEGLHLLARAYIRPGDEVIVSQHGFIVHKMATHLAGGTPIVVPEVNYRCDIDAMLKAITDKTRMLFIANPGNPTGTYLPISEIRRLHKALPSNILMVLDSAYAEFADEIEDYDSGTILIMEGAKNVVVTRTFSKMYGLAGLRVGWMYCAAESFIHLHKVRTVFNVNIAAQAAACAALKDENYVREYKVLNARWLEIMSTRLNEMGILTTPSAGNFVLTHFSKSGKSAEEAFNFLRQEGILVRPVKEYDLPDSLRISIGMPNQNEELLTLLASFIRDG
jgi:histidinol-phosphate aminotransferase